MSGTLTQGARTTATGARTTTAGRMKAMARAELILLGRHKAGLVTILVMPLILTFASLSVAKGMDLEQYGLSLGTMLIPTALTYVMIGSIYTTLVGTYVTRREELVLKRLRTGEQGDMEILAGTSIAALVAGLVQSVLLLVAGVVLLDAEMPSHVLFVAVGIALGIALAVLLAVATTAFTKSVEGAQLTIAPVMFLSMFGSGLFFPLEALPDTAATICELLPFSPVVELMRGGWSGGLTWTGAMGDVAVVAAWTVLSVYTAKKRFHWEPRR
ncbi:ABC transporter permease [Streptomyces candidus]|uniref:Transport permease protein n=1 Tax=Streptomyces candidus TaxID=67283 RepID=A0A7X0HIT3_9ACTN|nr:ABC transporter permease [Streptomyces candidus]MBB6437152.1 ABC-2 type transport system permease protein [Streptomyces candidus]GHH38011.1 transport permease protein [Streptomyces candidus]